MALKNLQTSKDSATALQDNSKSKLSRTMYGCCGFLIFALILLIIGALTSAKDLISSRLKTKATITSTLTTTIKTTRSPTQTSTSTPTPTPTVDDKAMKNYVATVDLDVIANLDDADALIEQDTVNSANKSNWNDALVNASNAVDDVTTAQNALKGVAVPSDAQQLNSYLTKVFSAFLSGATQAKQGAQDQSLKEVMNGYNTVVSGTNDLDEAKKLEDSFKVKYGF